MQQSLRYLALILACVALTASLACWYQGRQGQRPIDPQQTQTTITVTPGYLPACTGPLLGLNHTPAYQCLCLDEQRVYWERCTPDPAR